MTTTAAREAPPPGVARLWLFDLEAEAAEPSTRAASLLSADERARAARFVFPRDRDRYIAAHAAVRRVLGRVLDVAPARVSFATAPDGKPVLADPSDAAACSFNLSHSGRWALLGVTPGVPIGVDIEVHRPMPDASAVARRHFAASEVEAFEALPAAERTRAFFACWTRKEAYVKAIGTGLATPLDRFEVAFLPGAAAALRSIEGSTSAARAWTLADLDVGREASAAVAVRSPCAAVEFVRGG